jgi:hypothetical protein
MDTDDVSMRKKLKFDERMREIVSLVPRMARALILSPQIFDSHVGVITIYPAETRLPHHFSHTTLNSLNCSR